MSARTFGMVFLLGCMAACGRDRGARGDDDDDDDAADGDADADADGDADDECEAGYERDGADCVDIDECAAGTCDELATCTNEVGSFTCDCPDGYVGGTVCQEVGLEQIGDPTWRPTGFFMTQDTLGFANDASGFVQIVEDALSPFHAYDSNWGIFSPQAAHQGPYDREVSDAFRDTAHRPQTVFSAFDFTAPEGMWLVFELVPTEDAPTGQSPDFADGPILPNAIFPLATDGDLLREGEIYDGANDGTYPSASDVLGVGVDGWSHVPLFFATSDAWAPSPAPPIRGTYNWRILATDAGGNGWLVTMDFEVE